MIQAFPSYRSDDSLDVSALPWSRDVKVENTTAVVSKHDKNEQNFKPDRMHREKIDRTELRDVVLEECFPGLGWRLVMTDHVFRHRCLGNLDT